MQIPQNKNNYLLYDSSVLLLGVYTGELSSGKRFIHFSYFPCCLTKTLGQAREGNVRSGFEGTEVREHTVAGRGTVARAGQRTR